MQIDLTIGNNHECEKKRRRKRLLLKDLRHKLQRTFISFFFVN